MAKDPCPGMEASIPGSIDGETAALRRPDLLHLRVEVAGSRNSTLILRGTRKRYRRGSASAEWGAAAQPGLTVLYRLPRPGGLITARGSRRFTTWLNSVRFIDLVFSRRGVQQRTGKAAWERRVRRRSGRAGRESFRRLRCSADADRVPILYVRPTTQRYCTKIKRRIKNVPT
jgi:hypothetical protein